jgi:mono/diheme cytochrome c family protein
MEGYKRWHVVVATILTMTVLAVLGIALFVVSGMYNVTATKEDPAPIYHLVHLAMHRSIKVRADDIHVPDLDDPARISRGFALFHDNCVQCHGAPGVAPEPFTFGMRPLAPPLNVPARDVPAAQIYWVVKNGIKMTAMPAWERRLDERSMWDVTAFVKHLPELSPADYRQRANALAPGDGRPRLPNAVAARPGNPEAGRRAVEAYLCVTCHKVPGIAGGNNTVGPPLAGIATRQYIGGTLPNTPDNMLQWLRDPQKVKPGSAMPKLEIDEQDLRDMTAFLYTLDKR